MTTEAAQVPQTAYSLSESRALRIHQGNQPGLRERALGFQVQHLDEATKLLSVMVRLFHFNSLHQVPIQEQCS